MSSLATRMRMALSGRTCRSDSRLPSRPRRHARRPDARRRRDDFWFACGTGDGPRPRINVADTIGAGDSAMGAIIDIAFRGGLENLDESTLTRIGSKESAPHFVYHGVGRKP